MSLFVGNVSKKVTPRQFQEQFMFFGRCKVDLRKRFAFVQYQNERNAEEAKKQLQNRNFSGLRLNIEWSKNSGRFNENSKNMNGRKYISKQQRRSRSREDKGWRRDDRWFRRSPSYEKRSSPTYSDHQNLEDFEPMCPRDAELLRRIKQKNEAKRLTQLEKEKQIEVEEKIQDKMQEEKPNEKNDEQQKRSQ